MELKFRISLALGARGYVCELLAGEKIMLLNGKLEEVFVDCRVTDIMLTYTAQRGGNVGKFSPTSTKFAPAHSFTYILIPNILFGLALRLRAFTNIKLINFG